MKVVSVITELCRKLVDSTINGEFDAVADIKFASLPRESKENCVFNEFARGVKEPDGLLLNTDTLMCFHDYKPAADFHILVIPKEPVHSVLALRPDQTDVQMVQELMQAGQETMARLTGEEKGNFLMGFHIPPANSVNHLHLHVLGGKLNRTARFKFPPGNRFFYADAQKVIDRLTQLQEQT